MGSIISELLLCPACKKSFCLEAGDPRDLKCGHSICSNCLDSMMHSNEFECPEPDCKQKNTYGSSSEIPISFTIKQIVQTYSEKKVELENPKTFNQKLKIIGAEDGEIPEEEKKFCGVCKDHLLPIEFGCTTCEEWLCGTCVCLQHSGFPKTTCKVYPAHIALANKKNHVLAELDKKIKLFEKLKSDGEGIDTSIDRLLQVMDKETKLLESIVDKFKEKEDEYTKEKQYFSECSGKVSRILSTLKGAKTPAQMKSALDFYFENKDFIHREAKKNDLFDVWRQCVSVSFFKIF